jgi:hypothetical protein
MFVMPKTKQMASRIFDFPLPLRPVIELKLSSLLSHQHMNSIGCGIETHHPEITVRV